MQMTMQRPEGQSVNHHARAWETVRRTENSLRVF